MADRGKKDSTPPPLLLMPAGGGLTLNPPDQPNVLMPIIQSEPSLLGPDEEGEADSFVGQGPAPPMGQPGPPQPNSFNYFQGSQSSGMPGSSDPFANIGQQAPLAPPQSNTPPMPPVSGMPGVSNFQSVPQHSQSGLPTMLGGGPPPKGPATGNMFRNTGPLRYAQPPQGTYATTGIPPPGPQTTPFSQPSPFQPPPTAMSTPPHPPTAMIPPMSSDPQASQPPPQVGAGPLSGAALVYQPVQAHWCFCKNVENKDVWFPFSLLDSLRIEECYKTAARHDPENTVIPAIGGRYDVNVGKRLRSAVYWEEEPTSIRRCTWFYKREGDNRYVPYGEDFAQKLEEEYRNAIQFNSWHKRLEFPGGETIVMHNPNVIVHFQASSQPDEWGNVQSVYSLPGDQMRPRVVKRGVDDFENIADGETPNVDHLVFVVHGIGANCDVKFRSLVECVDDFRSISHGLMDSHFHRYKSEGRVHRVEFLPVHWHSSLHSDATGIDRRLKGITLPSTPKLRYFVNDTLMDILFYTSPSYCQVISRTVGNEMNRLYQLFLSRTPSFKGTVSVAGHSLGSSILFDLLLHQRVDADGETSFSSETTSGEPHNLDSPVAEELSPPDVNGDEGQGSLTLEELLSKVGLEDKLGLFQQEQIDMESLIMCSESDLKDLGLPMGPRKKLQGILKEESEKEEKKKRQAEHVAKEAAEKKAREEQRAREGEDRNKNFGNMRLERTSSISVDYICGLAGTGQPIVQYPQLDFQPCGLFAMGSPIGVFLSVRGVDNVGEEFKLPTCSRVFNIFHPFDPVAYRLEPLVNPAASSIKPVLIPHHKGRKRLHLELRESLTRVGNDLKNKLMDSLRSTWNSIHDFAMAHRAAATPESLQQEMDKEMTSVIQQLQQQNEEDKIETGSVASSHDDDLCMGQLNEGRRVDFVLQEKPIESFNDYLFALASHGCYWESEDTVLLFLKELYSPFGIAPQMPGPEGAHQRAAAGPSPLGPPPMSVPAGPPPLGSPPQGIPRQPPPGFSPGPFSRGQNPSPGPSFSPGMLPPTVRQGPPPMGMPPMQSPPQGQQTATVGPPPMSGFFRSPPKQ
ncbi:phospholipase DDHD2-like isoform X2 [Haliotis rufescens]|uniref:phospholipase DDHD2-like isoform X2 n=1 Tax=Haliotis rufescens TaxID=6454 RepID=UPI00201EDE46|nr:phospholipase DDHD2-like isoform X2 [Haliotis rufescens]